ncbi:unnamed protein product [Gemmata massiliana]|uniref:Uncharacterized protein n=1 Tax=Gemmata massiliana TaxID=1210884 RepID=A0A6P2DAM1_9BACT|nr:hypothetical protein [Gemmata massiliana]VTR97927.1 unnamed protein product [Gemmata massiliana]
MTRTDPDAAYSDLVTHLAEGDEVDAVEVVAICTAAGRTLADLNRDVGNAAGESPEDPQRGVTE